MLNRSGDNGYFKNFKIFLLNFYFSLYLCCCQQKPELEMLHQQRHCRCEQKWTENTGKKWKQECWASQILGDRATDLLGFELSQENRRLTPKWIHRSPALSHHRSGDRAGSFLVSKCVAVLLVWGFDGPRCPHRGLRGKALKGTQG